MEVGDDPRIKERFTLVPDAAGGWGAIAAALARKVADVVRDDRHHWSFSLHVDSVGTQRLEIEWLPWDVRVQIHDDSFDPSGTTLAPTVAKDMLADGWGEPDHFDGFHPAWWKHFEPPFDFSEICREAIEHFSAGFDFPAETATTLEIIQFGELG